MPPPPFLHIKLIRLKTHHLSPITWNVQSLPNFRPHSSAWSSSYPPLDLHHLTPLSCTHSFPANWPSSLSKKHQAPPLPGPLPLLFYLETSSPRTSYGSLPCFISFLGSEVYLFHLREASMTLSTPSLSPPFLCFVFLNSICHNLKLYHIFVFVIRLPHNSVSAMRVGLSLKYSLFWLQCLVPAWRSTAICSTNEWAN